MRGFPYTSLFTLLALLATILSMPFVEGQTSGLIAGSIIVMFYAFSYQFMRLYQHKQKSVRWNLYQQSRLQPEVAEELTNLKPDKKEEF